MQQPPSPAPLITRLALSREGNLTVPGDTALAGDLVILPREHAAIRFASTAAPTAASPWTWYRTRIQRQGRSVDQLRVEIGHPGEGGDPARNRFVVGTRDVVGGVATFHPCLSVDAEGTVTVHGDLDVRGLLAEGPIEADGSDPRFAAAAAAGFVRGAAGAATRVDAFFAAKLDVTIDAVANPVEGGTWEFTVTVTNSGTAAATAGQVHVVIGVGGVTAFNAKVLDAATFAPGNPTELSHDFDVPADSATVELKVSVLAVAIGAAANVVSATGGLSVPIQGAPIL
jgi:hypothetical protein